MKHLSISRTFRTSNPNGSPFSMGSLAITLGLITAVACGGTVDTGGGKSGVSGSGTGGASSADAGGAGGSGLDPAKACEDYFTRVLQPCGLEGVSPALPASEVAPALDLYRKSCAARLALPGTGFTPGAMAACVSDVAAKGCSAAQRYGHAGPHCAFLAGTLPAGAACALPEQCETGLCNAASSTGGLPSSASPGSPVRCGTCAAPGPKGQQCAVSVGSMGALSVSPDACRPDEDCDAMNTRLCVPLGNKVGASCLPPSAGPFALGCTSGLHCDDATSKCVAEQVVGKGQECGLPGVACAPHLVCSGDASVTPRPGPPGGPEVPPMTSGSMICKDPGAAGVPCLMDTECAPGLGCQGACHNGGAACTCAVPTFAGPGEPCDGQVRCRAGYCPGDGGRCPPVIADGQACAMNSPLGPPGTQEACQPFSSCTAGKCTPGYPACQ
jgi:hypothetical protein